MSNFVELLEEAGFEPFSYSGRGMYGKRCVAVTVTSFGRFFADILLALEGEETDLEELASIFEGMHWDSMGYDSVCYFPRIPWADDAGDENEEENESLHEVDEDDF
jgi:hypothetical protein